MAFPAIGTQGLMLIPFPYTLNFWIVFGNFGLKLTIMCEVILHNLVRITHRQRRKDFQQSWLRDVEWVQ